jgi:hypothetical protein
MSSLGVKPLSPPRRKKKRSSILATEEHGKGEHTDVQQKAVLFDLGNDLTRKNLYFPFVSHYSNVVAFLVILWDGLYRHPHHQNPSIASKNAQSKVTGGEVAVWVSTISAFFRMKWYFNFLVLKEKSFYSRRESFRYYES